MDIRQHEHKYTYLYSFIYLLFQHLLDTKDNARRNLICESVDKQIKHNIVLNVLKYAMAEIMGAPSKKGYRRDDQGKFSKESNV